MTPQEQQMIDGLIERVQNAPVAEKDFDAEQHIQQALSHNQNALYILVQTVLVQSYALEQAQKQLADTRQALAQAQQQPKHATSFLGGSMVSLSSILRRTANHTSRNPKHLPVAASSAGPCRQQLV